MKLSIPALLLALSATGVYAQQDSLAQRQLANGDRLSRDGKVEQARAAWLDVGNRYADSPAAPAALARLGASYYPVESFKLRGRLDRAALEQAKPYFERIAGNYRTSPEAPAALFKLGLLYSDPSAPFLDLDEAYARFSGLTTVYPGSTYMDEGLYGLADVLTRQDSCRRALVPVSQLLARYPGSPLAAQAHFLMGTCLVRTGQPDAAIRAFQLLRDESSDSPEAVRARDRITHLVRLTRADENVYRSREFIRPGLPEEFRLRGVTALQAGTGNHLGVVDQRSGFVHVLDTRGAPLSRTEVRRPSSILFKEGQHVIASEGELVVAGRHIPLRREDGREPIGEIGFLGTDERGRLLVWDTRKGDIVRYDRDYNFDAVVANDRAGRIDAVASGEDGRLYIMDARARSIRVLRDARFERTINFGLKSEMPRPDHLTVDFAGNLFVMDSASRSIGVFDGRGALLTHLVSGRAADDPYPRPVALAVNERGDVILFDERREGFVVLR